MDTENKILNPKTGRYVSKTGKIGRELLKKNIEKKENIENTKCTEAKIKECEKHNKICNELSGRCIIKKKFTKERIS